MKIEIPKGWLIGGLVVIVALISVLVAVLLRQPDSTPVVTIAKPAAEVKHAPRIAKQVKSVKVYTGGRKLKKKLNLPKKTVEKESEQVIAASKVGASEYDHTVTTVIDLDTGESQTYIRRDPLPWLALSGRGSVGLYYGLRNGRQAVRVQAHQEVIRIKRVSIAAIGSVDMEAGRTPDTFIGVGVAYRW